MGILLSAGFYTVLYYTQEYFPEGYEPYAEHFKKLPEVQLFYEKYENAKPHYGILETISYFATNEDWSADVELAIYHKHHSFEIKRIVLICHPIGEYEKGYEIQENIIEYLQNDSCFES